MKEDLLNNSNCVSTVPPFGAAFSTDYYKRSLEVLEISLSEVDAYKSWQQRDPGPSNHVDQRYAAMPALTKRDIRNNFPHGLLPHNRDVNRGLESGEIQFVQTSGTIEDKVSNIWNQEWWNASEKASWKLNSYAERIATGTHREAILANPLNVGFISDEIDLPIEKRLLSRFLYLNEKTDPLSWTTEYMDRMINELGIFKPEVLEANPSLLAKLCRYIGSSERPVFQPGLIVFTYEYPTIFHYRQIRQVFNVPIASSYGSTETGYVFMQCEEGKLHQNSEFCRVDFQPLKAEHGGPYLGRILVTTFNNPWYYLIRFDVGDLVRIDEKGSCRCGRDSGLILSAVEGRAQNVTFTCGGRLVTTRELDNALGVLEGVEEYQMRQLGSDQYRLCLVAQQEDKEELGAQTEDLLYRLYGEEAKVSIEFKKAISPEVSGKYRVAGAVFPVKIEEYLDEKYAC